MKDTLNSERLVSGIIIHEIANAGQLIRAGFETIDQFPWPTVEMDAARRTTKAGLQRLTSTLRTLQYLFEGNQNPPTEAVELGSFVSSFCRDPIVWGPPVHEIVVGADNFAPEQVNRALVETILRNLLTNALRYTPRGKQIRIRTRHVSGMTCISVANAGPPIPPETKAHLFSPGCHGTGGGTGLGLYIVQRCAQFMGGAINFRSTDRFTVFVVSFPTQAG